jgi:hypothetical protein
MTRALYPLAIALFISACGSPVESNADGSKVVHGANGDVTLTEAQAPKNLPAYATLYPGAQVISSVVTDAKTGSGGVVGFNVSAKPGDVIAFYEKLAASNKLTNKLGSPPDPDGTQGDILSEPGTQRGLTVSVGPREDGQPGTKVGLSYGSP